MEPGKLADLRARLERERDSLHEQIKELNDTVVQEGEYHREEQGRYGDHMADDASTTYEQEKHVALRRNLEDILERVTVALKKADQGTYGWCENCGEQIDFERLDALPYARFCITCQTKREARRQG
jgi:DnaK suppressor protein